MQIGLVGKPDADRAASLLSDLGCRLQQEGVSVLVDETTWTARGEAFFAAASETGAPHPRGVDVERMADADLVVSVGGDGTFLYAAHGAGTTPVMGVNLGEVGFLNAVPPDRAVEATLAEVARIREDGSPRTRKLPTLAAHGDDWSLPPAVNEVVVQGPQRGHGRGVDCEVRIDGSVYTSGHADGILVATSIGSTAYNLSEGGPLVDHDLAGTVVTEMSPEDAMPSLVVDVDATITVAVDGADRAVAISDGRRTADVPTPSTVTVERAPESVAVAGPPLEFFGALDKLA